jgi:hypothetical protein
VRAFGSLYIQNKGSARGRQLNSSFFNHKLAGSASHSYSESSPYQITPPLVCQQFTVLQPLPRPLPSVILKITSTHPTDCKSIATPPLERERERGIYIVRQSTCNEQGRDDHISADRNLSTQQWPKAVHFCLYASKCKLGWEMLPVVRKENKIVTKTVPGMWRRYRVRSRIKAYRMQLKSLMVYYLSLDENIYIKLSYT